MGVIIIRGIFPAVILLEKERLKGLKQTLRKIMTE